MTMRSAARAGSEGSALREEAEQRAAAADLDVVAVSADTEHARGALAAVWEIESQHDG